MANNSIFARNRHRANLQRNAFDLSQSSKFTASVGMLLPCFCLDVNPNEHFRINPSIFLRTVPMNSAAFVRLKQYCEFYFVPYRLLWRGFPQFISGTSNPYSNVITDGSTFSSTPYVPFSTIITGVHDYTNTDTCGYKFKYGATRLLDLLGYGINCTNIDGLYEQNKTKAFTNNVNPFRFMAYQKIYYDYYRNADYESITTRSFNIDDWKSGNTIAVNLLYSLMPRYRDWKKDYFNSISPVFQGSQFMNGQFSPVIFPSTARVNNANPDSDIKDNNYQGYLSLNTAGASAGITASNIRSAFALDKLYRLMISSKDGSYTEQMKTRFGVDAPQDDWKSTFIGAIDAPITIGDVETTADTYIPGDDTGSAAGTIYGKGTSLGNGSIEFTSKEHGIIMGIFSILPECDYASNQLDPFVTKFARSDYFQPEFMDLGKQPLPVSQFKLPTDGNFSSVLGYQLRYSEYKTNVDKIHGVFNSDSTFANQSYNAWVAPRNQALAQYSNGATVSFFKCLPSVLDSVMVQKFDGTESTDQFLINANFNCQAIRPMSIYGEPSLN